MHILLTQVTLTDGNHLTLANMRSNLELNQLSTETSLLESFEDPNVVSFRYKNSFFPWPFSSVCISCLISESNKCFLNFLFKLSYQDAIG